MPGRNSIMILCKVVDNFGDIGVVYRLARALSDIRPSLNLALVVSNLDTFSALAPRIDPRRQIQKFLYKNSEWTVIDWNLRTEDEDNFPVAAHGFQFPVILECFQCGRPEWLEKILFADDFTGSAQILNIDYLTAEDYAEEFHLLKSGTRKTNVKKRFFMPGFTKKTGGLIIGDAQKNADIKSQAESRRISASGRQFAIFFFAYDDDCAAVVQAVAGFQEKMRGADEDFSVTVFVAPGKSRAPFVSAWEERGSPFNIERIPFLPQEEFDSFILTMDFLFVRGEDSLARACLSGLPFVWQAYRQDENYQLVKVDALLERMREFFPAEEFKTIQTFWQSYNDSGKPTDPAPLETMLLSSALGKNTDGFRAFAETLHQNGDLARHLLDYIDSVVL